MSLPAKAHTLSIRGTLTVFSMLCAVFFQTTDVTSQNFTEVKFEVSRTYIALTHALCHTQQETNEETSYAGRSVKEV